MRVQRSRQHLDVQVEKEENFSVVALEGAIEAATVKKFRSAFDDLCREPGSRIILDCGELTYMNSASLGMLNRFHRSCEEGGGLLAICRLPPKIHGLIKLLGLESKLRIFDTRREARAAMEKNE